MGKNNLVDATGALRREVSRKVAEVDWTNDLQVSVYQRRKVEHYSPAEARHLAALLTVAADRCETEGGANGPIGGVSAGHAFVDEISEGPEGTTLRGHFSAAAAAGQLPGVSMPEPFDVDATADFISLPCSLRIQRGHDVCTGRIWVAVAPGSQDSGWRACRCSCHHVDVTSEGAGS